jgi:23S rRNA pseudouridine2605 synthase
VVKVNGLMTDEQEQSFREGVSIHGKRTSPAEIKIIKPGANPWYEVKITEGRQNQIRLMFAYFGKLVEKLRRVKIAFLELDVPPAQYRPLTPAEVEHFKKLLSAPPVPRPVAKPKAHAKPAAAKFTPKKKSAFSPARRSPIRSKFPKKKRVDDKHS